MKTDTENFLESLLFTAGDGPHQGHNHRANWTIHEFHPEFTAAVESFIDGFRAYLESIDDTVGAESGVYLDPEGGERSFGGNVYFSLSGHGCGFWDESTEYGDAMQAALEAYSGGKYRFEELDCSLMKFAGKIHLHYRTATYRREYLAKLFTPAIASPATV